ncbi:hypothetical protein [Amycolatopsis sp. NPDC051102]|uniref:hypothetical protein n=1 Tax=Amycolatopsis sp. NPDC051102 TaxID=3155163 RepID=UPI00343EB4C1
MRQHRPGHLDVPEIGGRPDFQPLRRAARRRPADDHRGQVVAGQAVGELPENPEGVGGEAAALDVRPATLRPQHRRRPRVEVPHQHVALDGNVRVRTPDALGHTSGSTAPAPAPPEPDRGPLPAESRCSITTITAQQGVP